MRGDSRIAWLTRGLAAPTKGEEWPATAAGWRGLGPSSITGIGVMQTVSPEIIGKSPMKSFDSRAYSINDFLEWENREQLVLNPRFQRRSVWSPAAKSYLMDTIVRGKPIPKIFMRQKINVTKKTTVREVVDGQQRLRTILSYLRDGFTIMKSHNKEFGGRLFSQLPDGTKDQLLGYEIAADLLGNLPDAEVLDIFSRLNAYAVVLNEQELLNAKYLGTFKLLADEIGRRYLEYWENERLISDRSILRMQEVSLVADLLIAMKEGIQSKKQIKSYYATYEREFDDDLARSLSEKFDRVIETISLLFPDGVRPTEFTRIHIFYSLFTAVAHCLFGIPGIPPKDSRGPIPRASLDSVPARERARNGLDTIDSFFEKELDLSVLDTAQQEFVQASRRATTDAPVRQSRTIFLLRLME